MKNNFISSAGAVPSIRYRRSKFDLSNRSFTSANVGTLYPFSIREIYPGDTFKVTSNFVIRSSSPFIKPVMDNLFCDVYYFFVPHRLVFEDFSSVFGENKKNKWYNQPEVIVPVVQTGSVVSGSVADYFGLPLMNNYFYPSDPSYGGISVMPFRSFAKVYDDWFRDENLIDPMLIQTGSIGQYEVFNDYEWSPSNYTGKLPKVAKMHDYFTSSLPSPQKGDPVNVPLSKSFLPLDTNGDTYTNFNSFGAGFGLSTSVSIGTTQSYDLSLVRGSTGTNALVEVNEDSLTTRPSTIPITGSNLGVSVDDVNISVNDLRLAFQTQKLLERAARGGTRYTEYINSTFGVSSPDARLQRSEFLGGKRFAVDIQQVNQTSAGTESDPLGQVGAFSLTNGKTGYTKGFVEHGYVIGVFCLRQFHTYSQGVEKMFTRKRRTDFHDPVFDHISEQPIYTSELYTDGSDINSKVFGYMPAWEELRMSKSYITGQMRSGLDNSLDVWHFGDDYSNAPSLNKQFIEETPVYVDRALTVPSTSQDQFIVGIYNKTSGVRVLSINGDPGLVDHY